MADSARFLLRIWATAWSLTLRARGLSKDSFKLRADTVGGQHMGYSEAMPHRSGGELAGYG